MRRTPLPQVLEATTSGVSLSQKWSYSSGFQRSRPVEDRHEFAAAATVAAEPDPVVGRLVGGDLPQLLVQPFLRAEHVGLVPVQQWPSPADADRARHWRQVPGAQVVGGDHPAAVTGQPPVARRPTPSAATT